MESKFRNTPVDQRRLTERDRRDYSRGTEGLENKRHRRVKARTAAINYKNSKPPRTGSKEGTGGFMKGRNIQQARLRKIGEEKRRSEFLREVN